MRDRETIDSELRRIALGRRSVREQGGQPSIAEVDKLLDERLGHPAETPESSASETAVSRGTSSPSAQTDVRPSRRRGVLRRFGPKAVLPATVLAVAIGLMMMFAAHRPDPAPPEAAPPPPSPQPSPVAPQAQAPPPVNIVDTAFVAALKHDGVPVPSDEYVTSHGHAVCDFLARQPDFTDAVRYVQQSSVWDANQSASVTAGAVVSYCPQYQPSSPGELQPGMQNALSDLQALERDLQGIQGDLKGIRDGLPALPGGQ